ncbi:hypothetical protein DMENIID0001_129110 [Sergentomyia squamirostris]
MEAQSSSRYAKSPPWKCGKASVAPTHTQSPADSMYIWRNTEAHLCSAASDCETCSLSHTQAGKRQWVEYGMLRGWICGGWYAVDVVKLQKPPTPQPLNRHVHRMAAGIRSGLSYTVTEREHITHPPNVVEIGWYDHSHPHTPP